MDLERLATLIEALKARIERHGPSLRENEIRTRMALIDPLLLALGWDTTDPATVMPEYNVKGQRADYALIGADGKPVAVIEAKKLGAAHADHLFQMVNYANMDGIPYAVLTDGNQWNMYDVFRRSELYDRCILGVSVVEGISHNLALDLLLLWRVNLATGSPVEARKPISSTETGFVSQPSPIVEPVAPPEFKPQDAKTTTGQDWLSLSTFQAADHKSAPSEIRYRDGAIRAIKFWNDMITESVSWAHDTGYLADKIPVSLNRTKYICNTQPVHPAGEPFRSPKPIAGAQLYCEVHGARGFAVDSARRLLQACGQGPEGVSVRIERR